MSLLSGMFKAAGSVVLGASAETQSVLPYFQLQSYMFMLQVKPSKCFLRTSQFRACLYTISGIWQSGCWGHSRLLISMATSTAAYAEYVRKSARLMAPSLSPRFFQTPSWYAIQENNWLAF